MEIDLKKIQIRDLYKGYENNQEAGVVGYEGNLNIRPPYQREFVYKDKQRDAVINTIRKGFPLNTMYWVDNDDGSFEVLDGQQRTVSICEYVNGNFSLDYQYFHNLTDTEQQQILDYELMVYFDKEEYIRNEAVSLKNGYTAFKEEPLENIIQNIKQYIPKAEEWIINNHNMLERSYNKLMGIESWVASWYDLGTGKRGYKSFSVNKYGDNEAFRLACEYRKKMIEKLNEQGAGYSENHGK